MADTNVKIRNKFTVSYHLEEEIAFGPQISENKSPSKLPAFKLGSYTKAKTPQIKLVTNCRFYQLLATCQRSSNKLVNFIKLQQICENQACGKFHLQTSYNKLVEKTYNNPVDNTF